MCVVGDPNAGTGQIYRHNKNTYPTQLSGKRKIDKIQNKNICIYCLSV